jgi:heme-degrading monooxygenase HmoA
MFIAMNRFQIAAGREQDFESVWRNRQSILRRFPGSSNFTFYARPQKTVRFSTPHIQCGKSRKAFEDWTNSESFRKAYGQARAPEGTYLGPPQFEGFDVVL